MVERNETTANLLMESIVPELEQTVEEIMGRWPATARVFIRRKMACVGCIMAPFQTLSVAARSYGISEHELLGEIRDAASADASAAEGGR